MYFFSLLLRLTLEAPQDSITSEQQVGVLAICDSAPLETNTSTIAMSTIAIAMAMAEDNNTGETAAEFNERVKKTLTVESGSNQGTVTLNFRTMAMTTNVNALEMPTEANRKVMEIDDNSNPDATNGNENDENGNEDGNDRMSRSGRAALNRKQSGEKDLVENPEPAAPNPNNVDAMKIDVDGTENDENSITTNGNKRKKRSTRIMPKRKVCTKLFSCE